MQLRLASYNIRKCKGGDGQREPGRTIDVVNALQADVVALQEVDHRLGPRPAALPADLIAAETDYAALPVALNGESLGWHGQTILMRKGLSARAFDRLELPALEPRGALLVEFGPEGGEGPALRLIAVHLGLLRRWRRLQMAAIRDRVLASAPLPTAILGDFNEWSVGGGMEPLTDHFHIHAPGRSFPATRPMGRLDRVALSAGLHLHEAGVLDTPLARVASDHLPVWADVTVNGL